MSGWGGCGEVVDEGGGLPVGDKFGLEDRDD